MYILNKEEVMFYYNLYKNGMSSCQLSNEYGHTHKYYLNYFKKYGLEIRSNKINSRKYVADFNYFNNIDSHEKAYWLGFIYADGYISNVNNYKKIGITLSYKDIDHIQKFKTCIHATYPIRTYHSNDNTYNQNCIYSKIIISNSQMYDALLEHGVFEHKTNILQKPNIDPQYFNSFILGYFDGDGSIYINNGRSPFYSISIVGTDAILKFIHNVFVKNHLTHKQLKLEKRKKNQTVSYIRYGGNILVSNIMHFLYCNIDCSIPLQRKYNLYLKCKQKIF